MCTKRRTEVKAVVKYFGLRQNHPTPGILQEAVFYEIFPILKPTQVESVRLAQAHRIYKYRIIIKDTFLGQTQSRPSSIG